MIELGLELTVIGMGAVFLFLVIMVFCMSAVAEFFKKYAHLFPEPVAEKFNSPVRRDGDDELLAVAIAFARGKTQQ